MIAARNSLEALRRIVAAASSRDASVGRAKAGQAVLFSVQAALQDGVMIYGQRVPSDGHVTFDVCNFSGTTEAAISDLPVHVLTFE